MSIEQQLQMPIASGNHYKIIQLDFDEMPYLLFSRTNEYNHSNILERFLKKTEIDYNLIKVKTFDIPSPIGDRYKVCGAGWAKVDVAKKQALFHGCSMDYDLGINKEHLYLMRDLVKNQDWNLELTEVEERRIFEARFKK